MGSLTCMAIMVLLEKNDGSKVRSKIWCVIYLGFDIDVRKIYLGFDIDIFRFN